KNYRKDFREKIAGKFKRSSAEFKKWNTFTGQAIAFVKRFEKTEGRNLILEVPGTRDPERVLYVGAHYDTITHDHDSMVFTPEGPAPGADDNASGLTALLWLADYFTAHPPGITLRFVAFDQEEIFFLGSYAFSRGLAEHKMPFQTRGRKTLGLVNLEMIGWSTKKGEAQAKIYTRPEGVKGVEADLALAAFFAEARVPSGPVVLKPGIVQNGFDRSDHWSFWQNGIPAICISEDWEGDFNDGNYHTRRDTPETLNYRYFEALLEWVKNGLLRLDAGWVTNSGP
ncbi:MAG: M28 family peptidase, partial [Proteobacteria bacterium]|nr:M28 family peptidase [Pseudomonadota bacterium]